MAMVTFDSGAVAWVINSLLSPRELSRIRLDSTGGTLEVDHLYGYRDASWSVTRHRERTGPRRSGATPVSATGRGPLVAEDDAEVQDVWMESAGTDVPSNHAAQIDRLVDDLLAGRVHDTTLASTRGTVEFVTVVYASALLQQPVVRADLVPGHPFYDALSGGSRRRRSPCGCRWADRVLAPEQPVDHAASAAGDPAVLRHQGRGPTGVVPHQLGEG